MAKDVLNDALGFSLLEAVVSMVFLTLGLVGLLLAFSAALRVEQQSREFWRGAVARFSQAQQLRADPQPAGRPLQIAPGIPPLYRQEVPGENSKEGVRWEVWRGQP